MPGGGIHPGRFSRLSIDPNHGKTPQLSHDCSPHCDQIMKTTRTQPDLLLARVLLAGALMATGVWLAHFSVASTPPSAPLTFGGPDPTTPGAPRYQNFYAPRGTSAEPGSGE